MNIKNLDCLFASTISQRFRGFLPIVVDIETSGFDANTNALLEFAACAINMSQDGIFSLGNVYHYQIEPFKDSILDPSALSFNNILVDSPLRGAISEHEFLSNFLSSMYYEMNKVSCNKVVLVGHNAHFDHAFLMAALKRNNIKKSPFHSFTVFDTATLSAFVLGQTVLSIACEKAGIFFDHKEAHSALYDMQKTAELFCIMLNQWKNLNTSVSVI